jgi:hypothetical protein
VTRTKIRFVAERPIGRWAVVLEVLVELACRCTGRRPR